MIKIVVDSSCDLPDDYFKEKDIKVIPLYFKVKDRFYRDGVDIKSEEFVELLKKEKILLHLNLLFRILSIHIKI